MLLHPSGYRGLVDSWMCRSGVQGAVPIAIGFVISAFFSECEAYAGVSKVKLRILLATVVFGSSSTHNPAEEVTFQI